MAPEAMTSASLAARLPNEAELSLLDLVDRLLNRGVVVAGDATISVAGIDLVYLGLNLVLASTESLRERGLVWPATIAGNAANPPRRADAVQHDSAADASPSPSPTEAASLSRQELSERRERVVAPRGAPPARPPAKAPDVARSGDRPRPAALDFDPEQIESGLAKLVLTLVELIRQALERQAVRRMEGGGLSDEEVERLGLALLRLQEKLHEIARLFGLQPDDLDINLGPLGNLL